MRLHPYRTTRDAIAGVVLSFIDINDYISEKLEALGRLTAANEFSVLLASLSETPVVVLDSGLRVLVVNDAFRRLGTEPPREGQRFYDAHGGAWNTVEVHALLEEEMPREVTVRNRRLQIELPGLGRRWVAIDGCHICDDDGPASCRFLAFRIESPQP